MCVFLLVSSWGTTSSVDQTALVITARVSPSLSFLCSYGFPFLAWPLSLSPPLPLPLSLSFFFCIPLSLLFLPPFLSFFSRLNFSMRKICGIFCVLNLWMQGCLGSIMFQAQVWGSWFLELFYAQPKGFSVIESVHVKDLWDLCNILISCLHQILSIKNLFIVLQCNNLRNQKILSSSMHAIPRIFHILNVIVQQSSRYTMHWALLSLGFSICGIRSCR